MRLELSKEQYKCLLEVMFAGAWLLNAWRERGQLLQNYEDVCQHLFSFHGAFDAQDAVDYDEKRKEFFLAGALETKLLEYIDQYNEHNFTEEFIIKMIKKKFNECGEGLTVSEKVQIEEEYGEAIRRHGINSLSLCLE
jgi:hypothetical protein